MSESTIRAALYADAWFIDASQPREALTRLFGEAIEWGRKEGRKEGRQEERVERDREWRSALADFPRGYPSLLPNWEWYVEDYLCWPDLPVEEDIAGTETGTQGGGG